MKAMTGTEFVRTPLAHAGEIPCDVSLTWTAVPCAAGYDVYLGTSWADVNTADRAHPQGVLVSQAQTATTYKPQSPLSYGQTYYWRVDFVGSGPAPTIYKGAVLDFTTAAYPIKNLSATASSAQPSMGPEKTIDGSGLDQNDGHSTNGTDMWLSTGAQPNWIQYQFDKVYSVRELWVWNSNQAIEPALGFGARTVKIEYSTDGSKWTQLDNVPEFARAPGQPGYVHNTTVSFGGISAQYVKLTIEKNWGGTVPQTGLSEVRFFYIPVQAAAPQPANNATGVQVDITLNWLPGRGAGSHKVFFGTDPNAVANGTATAKTVTADTFDPGALNYGTKYYWRVDEVNAVTYPGDVWSFTTQEFAVVDDFESYTDEEGQRIYQTWIDGETNKTGSQVGYLQSPFAEQTVIHGGKQSMPMEYNNIKTPFYSEATRTFAPVQNWTANGADTLTLWFRGNPLGFLQRADGSMQMSGSGTDIWNNSDQFRFAYQKLTGDGSIVAKVNSLANTDPWAKAGVMIRGSLDPAAMYAFMTPTPDGRRAFQNRTSFGATATSAHSNPGAVTFPVWVKVERKGGNYTGYWSQDGKNWTICQPDSTDIASNSTNPVPIRMTGDVYIGLAVTSHNASLTTIAEFSDVSFTGTVTGAVAGRGYRSRTGRATMPRPCTWRSKTVPGT